MSHRHYRRLTAAENDSDSDEVVRDMRFGSESDDSYRSSDDEYPPPSRGHKAKQQQHHRRKNLMQKLSRDVSSASSSSSSSSSPPPPPRRSNRIDRATKPVPLIDDLDEFRKSKEHDERYDGGNKATTTTTANIAATTAKKTASSGPMSFLSSALPSSFIGQERLEGLLNSEDASAFEKPNKQRKEVFSQKGPSSDSSSSSSRRNIAPFAKKMRNNDDDESCCCSCKRYTTCQWILGIIGIVIALCLIGFIIWLGVWIFGQVSGFFSSSSSSLPMMNSADNSSPLHIPKGHNARVFSGTPNMAMASQRKAYHDTIVRIVSHESVIQRLSSSVANQACMEMLDPPEEDFTSNGSVKYSRQREKAFAMYVCSFSDFVELQDLVAETILPYDGKMAAQLVTNIQTIIDRPTSTTTAAAPDKFVSIARNDTRGV